jgi:hypothetical protein
MITPLKIAVFAAFGPALYNPTVPPPDGSPPAYNPNLPFAFFGTGVCEPSMDVTLCYTLPNNAFLVTDLELPAIDGRRARELQRQCLHLKSISDDGTHSLICQLMHSADIDLSTFSGMIHCDAGFAGCDKTTFPDNSVHYREFDFTSSLVLTTAAYRDCYFPLHRSLWTNQRLSYPLCT